MVVPFGGSYLESYGVFPTRNYVLWGLRVELMGL